MPAAGTKRVLSSLGAELRAAGLGLRELWEQDRFLRWCVIVFAVTQWSMAWWDMPGAYGWENDGTAPRDLFGGIAHNLIPGRGHRYPLLHYLLQGLLDIPILLVAVVVAGLSNSSVMESVLSTPVMTAVAMVAKSLTIAMACVACLALARITRVVHSPVAARWAVLFAMTNLSVNYYSRVTNADVPYLFWTTLAIDRLVVVVQQWRSKDLTRFAWFVAAALATKDPAYATFVLVGPIYLVALPLLDGPSRTERWQRIRDVAKACALGVVFYALLSGAAFNPTGFLARVHMLLGTNSQDYKAYEAGLAGVWANLLDLLQLQPTYFWPIATTLAAWAGVVSIGQPKLGTKARLVRALPLLCGVSSVVFFTLVVARAGPRFALPLGWWLSVYGGVACAVWIGWCRRRLSGASVLAVVVPVLLVGWGALRSCELLVTQWHDPRRDVEAYLATLPRGSTVETYGLGVYLPRFDTSSEANYRVNRVGPDAPRRRPMIVGVHEVEAPYDEVAERKPDVLVIPMAFAERFLPRHYAPGEAVPPRVVDFLAQRDAVSLFTRAASDRLAGYELLDVGKPKPPDWFTALGGNLVSMHGSTAMPVLVLRRQAE